MQKRLAERGVEAFLQEHGEIRSDELLAGRVVALRQRLRHAVEAKQQAAGSEGVAQFVRAYLDAHPV